MALNLVSSGRDVPNEINVIIEIPKDAEPVKYEVDKATGAIFVDRVLSTPMRYPCNYGYVPHTLCGDGDPADVLVLMPLSLIPGSVIRVRPVGVLRMVDNKAMVDLRNLNQCDLDGECVSVCPTSVVSLEVGGRRSCHVLSYH